MIFSRVHARAAGGRRRRAPGQARGRRSGGRPVARPPTDAHHVAPRRDAAGRVLLGRLPRPPWLRRVVEARGSPDHEQASKRAMAVGPSFGLMRSLGHDRFAVVGHGRGAYVALRAAMTIPTPLIGSSSWTPCPSAKRWLARALNSPRHGGTGSSTRSPRRPQSARSSRTRITWYEADPDRMGSENHADYRRAIHDPATRARNARGLPGGPRA